MSVSSIASAAALPTAAPTVASAIGGGGYSISGHLGVHGFNIKHALMFAGLGAVAGVLIPVIPGGPIGGAIIGAAVSVFL